MLSSQKFTPKASWKCTTSTTLVMSTVNALHRPAPATARTVPTQNSMGSVEAKPIAMRPSALIGMVTVSTIEGPCRSTSVP